LCGTILSGAQAFADVGKRSARSHLRRTPMKLVMTFVTIAALALMAGCKDKSSAGGGSDKNDQFKISVKDTFKQGEDFKPGETKKITINIERGKEFKEPVKLFTEEKDLPKGVKVTFDPAEVKGDKSTSEMTVEVHEKDAPMGKQTITVHAKPEKGEATKLAVELNIKKAD
jgi:hypothetical protein